MNSETQCSKILRWLESGKSIDPIRALNSGMGFRLGARIHDLRGQGYPIQREMMVTKNGARVAKYFLSTKDNS